MTNRRTAAAALLLPLLVLAGLLLAGTATVEATSSVTLVASSSPAAVCDSDSDCAAYDAAHGVTSDGTPGSAGPDYTVAEDDAAFDCTVDGNLQCGPGVAGGPVFNAGVLVCPAGGALVVNELDVAVCFYGTSA